MSVSKLSMDITTGGFEKFLTDGGGIDFRLNESCWSPLEDGDVFTFVEDPGEQRSYQVRIVKKYQANNFSDLIDQLPNDLFDNGRKDDYLKFFLQWWSSEEETREGVLGLHIEVINGTFFEN